MIIGSTAIKHHFPDYPKVPKDLDILLFEDAGLKNSKGKEYFVCPEFAFLGNEEYMSPNMLYTLKMSHLNWDINWDKHVRDLHFLRDKGCKLDIDAYNIFYKEWERRHGKKNVKLTGYNNDFFNNNVNRTYDHDELHQLLCFYDSPMHNRIRPNKNKPAVSEQLWNNLSHLDKLYCALEEVYVIAVERYSNLPLNYAVYKAARKLAIDMTKGFFHRFLVDNFDCLVDNVYNRGKLFSYFKETRWT